MASFRYFPLVAVMAAILGCWNMPNVDGPFFDWFLVRRASTADVLFAADPSIVRVAHFESWWLYHRRGSSTGP